jgi:hypothetical protein
MIILIINNKPYHYEIIETVINKYYEILNIKKQKEMPTFFLEIKDNAEFSNYIKEKYSNIKINNHIFFGYDYLINCSIYSSDYEMVKNQSSSKNYYICHDVTYEMKKFTNVRFLTPLSNINNHINCNILPYYDLPKVKTEIPTYIIQGELTMYRRDYSLLKIILEGSYEYPYKFIIMGKGPPCKELMELCSNYQDKLEMKCDLTFLDYHKEFISCYCLFPCVSYTQNPMYYTNKLTSSINYAKGYNLPILLDKSLQSIYKCKKSYVYKNSKKLRKYFEKSLQDFYKKSIFQCLY